MNSAPNSGYQVTFLFFPRISFILQLGKKSRIFLLRPPPTMVPILQSFRPGRSCPWLSHLLRFLPLPFTAASKSWSSVSHGACRSFQGHLASAPLWAVGVLQWTMTSFGQVPHIVTPWEYHGRIAPGIQPSYKPTSTAFLSFAWIP